MAQAAKGRLARAKRLWALIAQRRTMRAYARLFTDADGALTADAQLVLADLAVAAGMGKVRPTHGAEALHFQEGKRGLLLHVLAKMDPSNIELLASKIREARNDRADTE